MSGRDAGDRAATRTRPSRAGVAGAGRRRRLSAAARRAAGHDRPPDRRGAGRRRDGVRGAADHRPTRRWVDRSAGRGLRRRRRSPRVGTGEHPGCDDVRGAGPRCARPPDRHRGSAVGRLAARAGTARRVPGTPARRRPDRRGRPDPDLPHRDPRRTGERRPPRCRRPAARVGGVRLRRVRPCRADHRRARLRGRGRRGGRSALPGPRADARQLVADRRHAPAVPRRPLRHPDRRLPRARAHDAGGHPQLDRRDVRDHRGVAALFTALATSFLTGVIGLLHLDQRARIAWS